VDDPARVDLLLDELHGAVTASQNYGEDLGYLCGTTLPQ